MEGTKIVGCREEEREWEKVVLDERGCDDEGLRKGQWTPEEDLKLSTHISLHGQTVNWNSLAQLAGLKRSGKSCRLRWLNYLRPDLRRGTFTLEEQLRILQLHFQFGNRWSKIAKELPGRTDNQIKNYWRTKVQKLAKRFNCDANSPQFREALLHTWMPTLVDQIRADRRSQSSPSPINHGPIYETRIGPEEPNNEPNISNLGCWYCTPNSMQAYMEQPGSFTNIGPDMYPDPYEPRFSPDSGWPGCSLELDYWQTWEHNSTFGL